jgi:hypothetical protein
LKRKGLSAQYLYWAQPYSQNRKTFIFSGSLSKSLISVLLLKEPQQRGNSVKSDIGHGWGFVSDPNNNNNTSFEQRRFSSNLGEADKPSKQMTYETRIIRFLIIQFQSNYSLMFLRQIWEKFERYERYMKTS